MARKKNKTPRFEHPTLNPTPREVRDLLIENITIADQDVNDVLATLQDFKARDWGHEYSTFYLDATFPGYDGGYILHLVGLRAETPEEVAVRVEETNRYLEASRKAAEAAEKQREKRDAELAELRRLKAKYPLDR